MIRLGLCCKFHLEPIAFKTTTVAALARLPRARQLDKLAALALANAEALQRALAYCVAHGIGAFRVNSQILPVKTHPQQGYAISDLPESGAITDAFEACGRFAVRHGLRLSFHPDQFILLSAPDPEIVRKSALDLVYQAEVAEWIGADVINIHAGGAYGDKPAALERLAAVLPTLPAAVRERLTFENDDRLYTPADLLPFCEKTGAPFVYDVHHHRCLPDGLSVSAVTQRTCATWNREPLLHVSSPREGHGGNRPGPHHDFIDPDDFPDEWRALDAAVDVEAKAKEVAIERLQTALAARGIPLRRPSFIT